MVRQHPAAWRRAEGDDDGLEISVVHRTEAVYVHLAGDLDAANAGRFAETLASLRGSGHRAIVVDTRALRFLAVAGHREVQRALTTPDGRPDTRVFCVVGPAVARMRRLLALAVISP